MGQRYGEEFKREAVRLALTSGLSRKQISTDFGMGFSTLNKWVQRSRDEDLLKGPQVDQEKELSRLRKENRISREKKRTVSWQMSMPRSNKRSSTWRSESGYRTYIITARRITLGITARRITLG